MFSVIFPGQGSQIVGMGKEFFEKHEIVKKLFKDADETLGFGLSKIILEQPLWNIHYYYGGTATREQLRGNSHAGSNNPGGTVKKNALKQPKRGCSIWRHDCSSAFFFYG